MSQKIKIVLRASILILITSSISFAKGGSKKAVSLPFDGDEITFWDIDEEKDISAAEKMEMKEHIIHQLEIGLKENDEDNSSAPRMCICNKIYGPVICDSEGGAHINICLYLCQQRIRKDLSPKKVLTQLGWENVKEVCKL